MNGTRKSMFKTNEVVKAKQRNKKHEINSK